MEYIDTDLDGIREIVCMYKEVMESIKSLRRITQKIYDEFETDTEGALRRIQTITIYNTMHMKDYYGYAFALDNNGNGCYLTQYMIGDSANWRKQVTTQQMGVIGKALLGPKNQKEEEAFYDVLKEIFQEAFNQC